MSVEQERACDNKSKPALIKEFSNQVLQPGTSVIVPDEVKYRAEKMFTYSVQEPH